MPTPPPPHSSSNIHPTYSKLIGYVCFTLNDLRIIPRIVICGYAFLIYQTFIWATSLPDISMGQAAVIATIFGITAPVVSVYHNSGSSSSK